VSPAADGAGDEPDRYVFDTSALYHAALAERLDVLGDLTGTAECVTTRTVLDELRQAGRTDRRLLDVQRQGWLTEVRFDGLAETRHLVEWMRRLEIDTRDYGELTVIAYAQMHGAVVIVDDKKARRLAKREGLRAHGSLWLIAAACRAGRLSDAGARSLVDALVGTGARLPCAGAEFRDWAADCGLLGAAATRRVVGQ
jgi:predicted nucleic acid-binding protein